MKKMFKHVTLMIISNDILYLFVLYVQFIINIFEFSRRSYYMQLNV